MYSRQARIPAHQPSSRDGLPDHGGDWLRGEANTYSREQHFGRGRIEETYAFGGVFGEGALWEEGVGDVCKHSKAFKRGGDPTLNDSNGERYWQ